MYIVFIMHSTSTFSKLNARHEIKTNKCSDTCQYKIKFVLTFIKNDLTLVEITLISGSYQIQYIRICQMFGSCCVMPAYAPIALLLYCT